MVCELREFGQKFHLHLDLFELDHHLVLLRVCQEGCSHADLAVVRGELNGKPDQQGLYCPITIVRHLGVVVPDTIPLMAQESGFASSGWTCVALRILTRGSSVFRCVSLFYRTA